MCSPPKARKRPDNGREISLVWWTRKVCILGSMIVGGGGGGRLHSWLYDSWGKAPLLALWQLGEGSTLGSMTVGGKAPSTLGSMTVGGRLLGSMTVGGRLHSWLYDSGGEGSIHSWLYDSWGKASWLYDSWGKAPLLALWQWGGGGGGGGGSTLGSMTVGGRLHPLLALWQLGEGFLALWQLGEGCILGSMTVGGRLYSWLYDSWGKAVFLALWQLGEGSTLGSMTVGGGGGGGVEGSTFGCAREEGIKVRVQGFSQPRHSGAHLGPIFTNMTLFTHS